MSATLARPIRWDSNHPFWQAAENNPSCWPTVPAALLFDVTGWTDRGKKNMQQAHDAIITLDLFTDQLWIEKFECYDENYVEKENIPYMEIRGSRLVTVHAFCKTAHTLAIGSSEVMRTHGLNSVRDDEKPHVFLKNRGDGWEAISSFHYLNDYTDGRIGALVKHFYWRSTRFLDVEEEMEG